MDYKEFSQNSQFRYFLSAFGKSPGVPSYTNSKNQKIVIEFSKHAKTQFQKRLKKLADRSNDDFLKLVIASISEDLIDSILTNMFLNASKKEKVGKLKTRDSKHGGDSIFFKFGDFNFVVCNRVVKTVELNGEYRRLN